MFTGIAAVVLAFGFWSSWYADLMRVAPLFPNRKHRIVLGVVPVLCITGVVALLRVSASHDVRENPFWIAYYAVLGAAWVGLSMKAAELLGIDVRDDVLERRNSAAFLVSLAALVSFAITYGGGNIGDGPGVEAVAASAGLATLSQLVLWFLLDLCTDRAIAERITVERDNQAAVRLAGMLLCNSVILGMAAAGPWIPDDVLLSFAKAGWPALVVTAFAVVIERSRSLRRISNAALVVYPLIAVVDIWRQWR